MVPGGASRLAGALGILTAAIAMAGFVILVVGAVETTVTTPVLPRGFGSGIGLLLAITGVVLVRRGTAIGWPVLAAGTVLAAQGLAEEWSISVRDGDASLAAGDLAHTLAGVLALGAVVVPVGVAVTIAVLRLTRADDLGREVRHLLARGIVVFGLVLFVATVGLAVVAVRSLTDHPDSQASLQLTAEQDATAEASAARKPGASTTVPGATGVALDAAPVVVVEHGDSGGVPLLPILAALAVGAGLHPLSRRLRGVGNRVAFGQRAAAYDLLDTVSRRLADADDPDDVLAQLSASLTAATAAEATTVWLRVHDELLPAASWPPDAVRHTQVFADDEQLPGDLVVPIHHEGERLGAISVWKPTIDRAVVAEVATHAGVFLANVRLRTELEARVDELRESRQRLVTVQDHERRRFERDLHDGAQQQLVTARIHTTLAHDVAEDEGAARTAAALDALAVELAEALTALRDLAHGIYPPRLAADGLVAALRAHAGKVEVPLEVRGDVGRFDQGVESAVYFCCLEALQNVAKYAAASSVTIELSTAADTLVFAVADDGDGFDPQRHVAGAGIANMRDRIEALGGSLHLSSARGAGTRVEGRIPVGVLDLTSVAPAVSVADLV